MWTIADAIMAARRIEAALIPIGYHCAIGGSVLHLGSSEKDLDVFIYPHTKSKTLDNESVRKVVADLFEAQSQGDCSAHYQERDEKSVSWLVSKDGQRIDLFFLS